MKKVYNENLNKIILSHKEDIDGIVSAALLFSYLQSKNNEQEGISVHLLDYTSLLAFFEANILQLKKCDFYLADLGLNEKFYQLLCQLPILDNFTQNHQRFYFDHHKIVGDISTIKIELEKRFSKYINSSLDYGKIKLCSAEVIYFNLNFEDSHFRLLCDYANIVDFKNQDDKEKTIMANVLNRYINYYQRNDAKLLKLVQAMQSKERFAIFKNTLVIESIEINKWYNLQYQIVENQSLKIVDDSCKIIISLAKLKSEEIVNYLTKKEPNYDLYIGFSQGNNYTNIQSKINVAHIIASGFGGGGHSKRAGFKIPFEIQAKINQNKFVDILSSSFINRIKSHLKEQMKL